MQRMSGDRPRWSGERIGRLSLQLDAAYCTVVGAGVALGAPAVASSISAPAWVFVVAGATVVLWAGLIVAMMKRLRLRTALRLVMTANLLAALAVAAVSTLGATLLILMAVLTVAVDITLFAGSQALALRRMRPTHP